MKMVIYPPVEAERRETLEQAAAPMRVVVAANPAEALREIADAEAFFGKLTPELLRAARQLRWVQCPTASLEHYVFPELVEHPAQLTNMRGLFSDCIADHVMGLVIALARNLHTYIRNQVRHVWEAVGDESQRSTFETGPGCVSEIDRAHRHLGDLTLGIVGLGAIGREIARRAAAFGMQILAVDPDTEQRIEPVRRLMPPDRLDEMLPECDYVVIAAPHTPATEKMFRTPQFERMRETACLINIGRGAIVDLAELTEALQRGEIGGAALDVFEIEPLPQDHPLWDMPNVIITPHVAGASPRIAERHLEVLKDNVDRFVRGQPLRNIADKANWY